MTDEAIIEATRSMRRAWWAAYAWRVMWRQIVAYADGCDVEPLGQA